MLGLCPARDAEQQCRPFGNLNTLVGNLNILVVLMMIV